MDQCKDQYYRLSKIYHPDSQTGSQDKFVSIKHAFEEIQTYFSEQDSESYRKRMYLMQEHELQQEQTLSDKQAKYWE
jgi:curved DNA-binding protein CbpA